MKLLTRAAGNAKFAKSDSGQWRVCGLSLSPAESAGPQHGNNCPSSSAGCRAVCVGSDAVGLAAVFDSINQSRRQKTIFLKHARNEFIEQLCDELRHEAALAEAEGRQLACRLNTFSDLPWEHPHFGEIPQRFPNVQFYDYTKIVSRVMNVDLPANYALCLSWSEDPLHQARCIEILEAGRGNVSVVFYEPGSGFCGPGALRQRLPRQWRTFGVYDGDTTDLRFLDPGHTRTGRSRICGLRLKAGSEQARLDAIASGFAVASHGG